MLDLDRSVERDISEPTRGHQVLLHAAPSRPGPLESRQAAVHHGVPDSGRGRDQGKGNQLVNFLPDDLASSCPCSSAPMCGLAARLGRPVAAPIGGGTDLSQVTAALKPTTLEIYNDSHLHRHHQPMQGSTSNETHFRLVITSEAFQSKSQPARHRLVYNLLKEEMAREGGIHALQLRTMTPEEEAKRRQQEAAKE